MAPSTASAGSVLVAIHEREILKAILEFLESRKFHITQLSLERETGLINGDFPEDVLFLRQLILDGQWDSVLEFVEPLKELAEFDSRSFRYFIVKYKFYELLCIKMEPGPMHDNDFAVEEIVECLKELEAVCSSAEEFRRLCALLTLPKLSDHKELKSWNPSNARMECFYKILPLISELLGGLGTKPNNKEGEEGETHALNDRLVQLVAKGLLYEGCVDYCQAQALQGKNAPVPENKFVGMLFSKPKLSSTDLSLVSWLQVLGKEQFTAPFEQKTLEFKLDVLKKPRLEAQWTEQILATPMKPGGQFPHSLVPHSKLKCAQRQMMSQSMVLPCMFSSLAVDLGGPASANAQSRRSNKNLSTHPMSQSTTASIGSFSIRAELMEGLNHGSDVMKQSQLISNMLEQGSSELSNFEKGRSASISNSSPPPPAHPTVSGDASSATDVELETAPLSPSPPAQSSSSGISMNSAPGSAQGPWMATNNGNGSSQSRRELDAICRRNQTQAPASLRCGQGSLPSVPELATPTGMVENSFAAAVAPLDSLGDNPMTHSRLFQEFSTRQQQQQRPQGVVHMHQQHQQQYPPMMYNNNSTNSQMMPTAIQNYPMTYNNEYGQQGAMMAGGQMAPYVQQQHPQQITYGTQYQPALPPPPVSMRQNLPFSPQQLPPSIGPQYNTNQQQRPVSMVLDSAGIHQQMQQPSMPMLSQVVQRPRSYVDVSNQLPPPTLTQYTQQQQMPPRPDSIVEHNTPHHSTSARTSVDSNSGSSLPVHFVPLCRYEDPQAIRAVSFHPSGKYFVIGTNSKQMLVCKYPDIRRLDSSKTSNQAVPPSPEVLLSRPKQHRGSVYCCGFNTNGELLATGSNDKTLRLMAFNADECKIGAEMELMMHDGTVRELIFMEDTSNHSSVVVSGGAGNCHICLTDCTTGRTFKSFVGHTAPILGLYSWGPTTTSFASCSQDKTIRFWDLRASNAVNVIMPNDRTSNSPVTSVCVDPSGKLLVSGHEDASVMLYDIIGGRTVQIFRPHGDEVRTVRCSNAAYYLLSGSYDKRVVITDMRGDLTTPLMYLPVAEHTDKVIQCRWHPQDFTFLSTSADRSAVLWSLPTQPAV